MILINMILLSPYQCLTLSKSSKPEGLDTSSLHCLITVGGSMPKSLVNDLRDALPGTYISQIYGQTELCGAITRFETRKVDDRLLLHYKHNSVGRAMPGFWYKRSETKQIFQVVDTVTEKIVGPNEPGELRIKSGCVMNGYLNRDSSEAFDQSGWLRTGDVVYYDEFQCFTSWTE
ncbi:hypothetical protein WA026_020646 [Henosepilachna vigintioctopunctata]|uniref:AMP-dependent synthetase/ligase domain-containing protein n=1 Tax=Henosepilachna vigintioctopunctata TaxID=420089 RepID=A0AAW1U610_9CUCU